LQAAEVGCETGILPNGANHGRKSQLGVQVIARAAEVLRALEANGRGLSLGQLARQLNLPKSTVQRIVAALDRENFVIAATPQAGVRLGPALVSIARSAHCGLADIARPCLEKLAQRTGETVDLALLKGAEAVFMDHIEGSHRLRAVSAIGVSFPLHCSANGKAMLSALSDPRLAQMKKKIRLTRFTPNSLTSWKQLQGEIEKIRETGIAYDLEEHTLGISAVGTPIMGPEGEIAAISVPTPSVRFSDAMHQLEAALKDCRAELNERVGTRHGTPSKITLPRPSRIL
jgi:IclR family acetate operon transcriptional repressor